jgi:hypothetical protein
VEILQYLISHGIDVNSEVVLLPLIPVYNASESEPCLYFTIPFRHARLAAASLPDGGFAAVDSPAANRQTRELWKSFTA